MKPFLVSLFSLVAVLLLGQHPAWAADTNAPARPPAVKLEKPGLPNLHRVSDRLYRSAQPTPEGFREIERLGIKTVVNLRGFHSDKDEVPGKHGLKLEHIRFNTWHPETEDMVRFLKIVTDTNRGPVLVHCQFGADRTGTMIALYRMAVQGWTKQEAIAEMTSDRFGFHAVWTNLVEFLKEVDVAALKKKAGITPSK